MHVVHGARHNPEKHGGGVPSLGPGRRRPPVPPRTFFDRIGIFDHGKVADLSPPFESIS